MEDQPPDSTGNIVYHDWNIQVKFSLYMCLDLGGVRTYIGAPWSYTIWVCCVSKLVLHQHKSGYQAGLVYALLLRANKLETVTI